MLYPHPDGFWRFRRKNSAAAYEAISRKAFLYRDVNALQTWHLPFRILFPFFQRSPLLEEHHPHKSIFNLHFIDILMDSYAHVTGEAARRNVSSNLLSKAFSFRFHLSCGSLQSDGKLKVGGSVKAENQRRKAFVQFPFVSRLWWRLMQFNQIAFHCQLASTRNRSNFAASICRELSVNFRWKARRYNWFGKSLIINSERRFKSLANL